MPEHQQQKEVTPKSSVVNIPNASFLSPATSPSGKLGGGGNGAKSLYKEASLGHSSLKISFYPSQRSLSFAYHHIKENWTMHFKDSNMEQQFWKDYVGGYLNSWRFTIGTILCSYLILYIIALAQYPQIPSADVPFLLIVEIPGISALIASFLVQKDFLYKGYF